MSTTSLFKTVFMVFTGLMPVSILFGVYSTKEKAEEAIKKNDQYNGYLCRIEEITLNLWIENGKDV